jgi:hypothetical protein
MRRIRSKTKTDENPKLLPQSELEEMNACFAANARKWLEDNTPTPTTKLIRTQKRKNGRQPKLIHNPFYGFIGSTTWWGRYPAFAMDIIEGVARLDWHDRPIGQGGKSNPLSVGKLTAILEQLPVVSNELVEDLLRLKERHARRYVKAIELIVPKMMLSRPPSLLDEMLGVSPEPNPSQWEDGNESNTPTPEELEKLHQDLQASTKYKTAEEYEAEYEKELWGPVTSRCPVLPFTTRSEHPKKAEALALLKQGMGLRAVARALGVSPNSIKSWRESAQPDQQAA